MSHAAPWRRLNEIHVKSTAAGMLARPGAKIVDVARPASGRVSDIYHLY